MTVVRAVLEDTQGVARKYWHVAYFNGTENTALSIFTTQTDIPAISKHPQLILILRIGGRAEIWNRNGFGDLNCVSVFWRNSWELRRNRLNLYSIG
jgi:hypothetical protein